MSSKKLFKKLVKKGLTIAFAESMTGGSFDL
jgi:nicotinamide mononucleotide (NMN) deamidase PncC